MESPYLICADSLYLSLYKMCVHFCKMDMLVPFRHKIKVIAVWNKMYVRFGYICCMEFIFILHAFLFTLIIVIFFKSFLDILFFYGVKCPILNFSTIISLNIFYTIQ